MDFSGGMNFDPTGKNIGETETLILASPLLVTTKDIVLGLLSFISAEVGATRKELAE